MACHRQKGQSSLFIVVIVPAVDVGPEGIGVLVCGLEVLEQNYKFFFAFGVAGWL